MAPSLRFLNLSTREWGIDYEEPDPNDLPVDQKDYTGEPFRLWPSAASFCAWVFGPDGVACLELIAFGNLSQNSWRVIKPTLVCRDAESPDGYRLLEEFDARWDRFTERYQTQLDACSKMSAVKPSRDAYHGPLLS